MELLPDTNDIGPAIKFDNPTRLRFRLINDALRSLQDENPRQALDLLTVCCRLPVVAPDDLLLRSELYNRLGFDRLAAADIVESFAIDPTHPEIAARYLAHLLACGEQDEAHRVAVRLARLGPDMQINAPAIRCLVDQQGADGVALVQAGDEAVRVVVLARSPDERSFTLIMGEQKLVLSCRLSETHALSQVLGAAAVLEMPWQPDADVFQVAEDGGLWWREKAVYRPFFRRHAAAPPARKRDTRSDLLNVIVPVYDGLDETSRCLEALFAQTSQRSVRIFLVDDCGPDPAIRSLLARYVDRDGVVLLTNPFNLGFVGSVNRALLLCPHGDVLLLNADALLPSGALERLGDAAYAEDGIGTVTPLSNNGEFTSFPIPFSPSPCPDEVTLAAIDAAAHKVNRGEIVDLPNGVGFCLYIREECRQVVGLLNDADFVDGYLEEVDYCLRAAEAGFRNVCACDIYVGHVGGASFGDRRRDLVMRNLATLQRAFPDIKTRTHRFVQSDPLQPARTALQLELLNGDSFKGGRKRLHIVGTLAGPDVEPEPAPDDAIVLSVGGTAQQRIRLHAKGVPAPFDLTIALSQEDPVRALLKLLAPFDITDITFDTWAMPDWAHKLPRELGVPHQVHLSDQRWLADPASGGAGLVSDTLASATRVFSVSPTMVAAARARGIAADLVPFLPPAVRQADEFSLQGAPRIAVLAQKGARLEWLKSLVLEGLASRRPLRFVCFSDEPARDDLVKTGMVTFADTPSCELARDGFAAFGCCATIVAFGQELRPGPLLSLASLAPKPCFVDREDAADLLSRTQHDTIAVSLEDRFGIHAALWPVVMAASDRAGDGRIVETSVPAAISEVPAAL